jgi:hypothetical protein
MSQVPVIALAASGQPSCGSLVHVECEASPDKGGGSHIQSISTPLNRRKRD